MSNITSIFGGAFEAPEPPAPEYKKPADIQLMDAIAGHGYEAPQEIIFDGKIHRFSTDGRKGKDSGWYVAYSGNICAGAFGDWKEGTAVHWRQDIGRQLSTVEEMEYSARMRDARKKREEETAKKHETAQDIAEQIWQGASDASNKHPYLVRKGVQSHCLKVSGDGRLVVPMLANTGELVSCQFIDADGEKKYLGGGKSEGAFFPIMGHGSTAYICEGYATAATVHEVTGATCYIAFSSGQLSAVAGIAKAREHSICIIADHDHINPATGNKPGIVAAEKAGKEHGARVVIPPIEGMDANDYHMAGHDLAALLSPPAAEDWLIDANDFCSQPSPIRWLIKGQLQRNALIMVHGTSGCGKTFVVLDMCLHLASGMTDWHGATCRPEPVVYLAGEGHHGLRSRLAAWKQHHNAGRLDMWLSLAGTDLNTAEGYQRTRASIDALPVRPGLIVVDTLHRFLLGDENSSEDAKTMLDACGALMQDYDCSVLLVHHTGVSDEAQHRARGSSAWRGALDIELSVVPAKEDEPMQLVQRKSKDAELAPVKYMQLQSVTLPWIDEDGEAVTSAVIKMVDNVEKQSAGHKKHEEMFVMAWQQLGQEYIHGCRYVSKSALKDWLISVQGMAKRTAENALCPSYDDKMMGALIKAGRVAVEGGGFILVQTGEEAAANLIKK